MEENMKVQIKWMTAFFVAFLLCLSIGCGDPKKQTIASSEFRDPGYCEKCHFELAKQWEGSAHSNAQKDPIYQKLYLLAEKETDGKAEEFCAASKCHTPIGYLANEIPPIDGSELSEISKLGVQCDFCHTVTDALKVGDGSYVVKPGKTKLGPYNDDSSMAHKNKYSKLHTQARFCGMCHNVNHPGNNLPLEATFSEWEDSSYNTGDPDTSTMCQDCHMTPGPTGTLSNPGQASSLASKRDLIYTHDFAGANVALANIMGSPRHAQLAEERLKAAARITVTAPGAVDKGTAMPVDIAITNSGAGHMLPTGLTEVRQMWLEVVATDANSDFIFSAGSVDAEGTIDPGATIYNTVLLDSKGKRTTHVWNAEKILSDNRIAPGKTKFEKFTSMCPKIVQVRLRLR